MRKIILSSILLIDRQYETGKGDCMTIEEPVSYTHLADADIII